MARVTVEDCLQNVDNRFQLVLVAARRARQLASGQTASIDWENDKATVVALREIADGHIDASILDKPELEQIEVVQPSIVTDEELGQLRQGMVDMTEDLGRLGSVQEE